MPESSLADWLKSRGLGQFGFRRCEVSRHPHLWNLDGHWPAVFHHLIKDMDARRRMVAKSPLQTCPHHSKDKSHAITIGRDGRVSVGGKEIQPFIQPPERRVPVYVWYQDMDAFVMTYFIAGTEPPHWMCANCQTLYTRQPNRGCNGCGRTHFFPPKGGDGA